MFLCQYCPQTISAGICIYHKSGSETQKDWERSNMAISVATSRALYPFWTYLISFQFPVNYGLLSQQICAVIYSTGKFNNKPSLAEAEMYQGSGALQYRSHFLLASGGTSPPAQNSTWTRLPASRCDWKPFNQSPLTKWLSFLLFWFLWMQHNSGKNPTGVLDITIDPIPRMVFFTSFY